MSWVQIDAYSFSFSFFCRTDLRLHVFIVYNRKFPEISGKLYGAGQMMFSYQGRNVSLGFSFLFFLFKLSLFSPTVSIISQVIEHGGSTDLSSSHKVALSLYYPPQSPVFLTIT